MKAAACYARLSQERGEEISVPIQIAECRADAERRGYEIPDSSVYADRNLSASQKGTVRPAFNQLVEDIRAGKVTALFCREQSRLYRRPRDLEDIIDLIDDGRCQVFSLFEGEVDLTNASGRMNARIRVSVDKQESERLSERVKLAKAARRADGALNGGGRRPYGYQRTADGLAINPPEAARIKEAAQRLLAGESMNRVVLDWNTQGIFTAGGGRWTPAHLKRILVGGVAHHRAGPLIAGGPSWPAILTQDEVALLQARLTAPSKHRPKQAPTGRKYALTGLLVCELCGSKMSGSVGFYRCAVIHGGCGKVGISARPLEQHLLSRIDSMRAGVDLAGRSQPDATAPLLVVDPQRQAELLATLRELEDRLADVGQAIGDGTLSVQAGSAAEASLVKKHTALQEKLALSGPTKPPAQSWAQLVKDDADWYARFQRGELSPLEVQDLHDAVSAWITSVAIAPRKDRKKRFNPDRVTVEWRAGVIP